MSLNFKDYQAYITNILGNVLQFLNSKVILVEDHFVHYYEKIWQKFKHTPSEGLWDEWLGYYANIHIWKSHDLVKFYRLVRRRGTPDLPNPYPEGVEEHYYYHPQGIMMGDIECILTPVALPKHHNQDLIDEFGEPLSEVQAQAKGMDRFTHESEERQLSLDCVSMALIMDGTMPRLINTAHKKDIEFVIIECLLNGRYEEYGLLFKKGLKNALKKKYIDSKVARQILDEKVAMVKEKRRQIKEKARIEASEKVENKSAVKSGEPSNEQK